MATKLTGHTKNQIIYRKVLIGDRVRKQAENFVMIKKPTLPPADVAKKILELLLKDLQPMC